MITKYIPERTCLGCKVKKPKSKLIRLILTEKGDVVVDNKNLLVGRGTYVCKVKTQNVNSQIKKNCLEKIIKKNLFKYAFRNKKIKSIKLYKTSNCSGSRSC